MGYWNGWGPSPVSAIDWGGVTHVIHWAALVNANGTIDLTTENISASAPSLISAAHGAGRKVVLGIMQPGWAGQTTNLQQAVSGNLNGLVSNIMQVVNTYGYDGVDIDWEPFDTGTSGTAMTLLASALKAQLGTRALTAAAVVSNSQYWGSAHSSFDRINMMTYDQTGTWNPYSWHNAALYDRDGQVWSVNLAVSRFTSAGVPASKLGIGIPFYGWKWTGGGITGPDQNWSSTPSLGQINYKDLASQITSQNKQWDSLAQVPYLSVNTGSSSTDEFLTYDDAQSIAAKINYVKTNNLGGWIIWELNDDYFPSQTPAHPLLEAVKNAMGSGSSGTTPTSTTPAITSASSLPTATVGTSYSSTLTASGSTPITWTLTGGALPAGLSLSSSSGLISGTPTSAGSFTFAIQASNAAGADSQQFTLLVNQPQSSQNYYVSDLNWASATIGWGTIHKDRSVLGNILTLNGVTYQKGIGTHANSQILYDIGGNCSAFQSDVGVDDEVRFPGSAASIVFQVFADNAKLYDSGLLTATSPTQKVNVSLNHHKQLKLVVTDGGDAITSDHADWSNAHLTCSAPPAAN
jgi:hypothetical protein